MAAKSQSNVPLRLVEALDPDALLDEHGAVLYALCRRLDPDPADAFQDVWAHLLPRLHRFDPARGAVRAWLRSIAPRRRVGRHRPRRGPRTQVQPDVPDPAPSAEARLDRARHRARLERAVAVLPDEQRRVVVAHHIHGRSLEQIAADEGVAIGTVKSRLHRGRARLVTLLEAP